MTCVVVSLAGSKQGPEHSLPNQALCVPLQVLLGDGLGGKMQLLCSLPSLGCMSGQVWKREFQIMPEWVLTRHAMVHSSSSLLSAQEK